MAVSKIALIFGIGPRVGTSVANKFLSEGYKVVTVSRTPQTDNSEGLVHVVADLSEPEGVEPVFDQVQERWGGAPDVVVYNAYGIQPTPENPLSASISELTKTLNINTVSSYAAATIAQKRNKGVTFIFTGNALNSMIIPSMTTMGVGKSGSAHFIQAAAQSEALKPATFYYCDQRHLDGSPCYTGLSGEAHAELYWKLANQKEQSEPIIVFRA